ncbi:hypothetical protein HD554DRAFT_2303563 [Boletus coccyginus]|nr:hypothetical protein HD554DRAFT_2303563 [Boletus coccyginus]
MVLVSTTHPDTPKKINVDSKIRALAFLPDESLRIVSGEESTVRLRHLEDGLMGETIDSSTGILAVAASKDGHWIITGTNDGLAIWNRVQDTVVRRAIGGVRAVDISSDSKWVVTGSDAHTADVWDISTGESRPGLKPFKHEYNVVAVKFCPCGWRIATATLFGSVRIYSISSGQKLLTIPISVTSTLSVSNVTLTWFAHRPQIFAVSQGQIKCLNSDDGSLVFQWPTRGVRHPSSVALSPNNKIIAYSINDAVVLRDTATRQQLGDPLKHDGNDVSCIAFSPRSDHLVTGADTKFTVWDLRKLLTDTLYFNDATIEPTESCAHHQQDTTKKPPPSTFSLPLMSISNGAVKPWLHGFLDVAEGVLSKEIENPAFVPNHDIFANRALIRGRLRNGNAALEDAEKSLLVQTSAIGHVAKTIAFIQQGEYGLAKQEIPKVLDSRRPESDEHAFLLEVIQSILFCLSGEYNNEVSHINGMRRGKMAEDQKLANLHLLEKQFEQAMGSFKNTQMPAIFPHDETREMWTISFLFGWKFSGLAIQIQQKKCEFLLQAGNSEAAVLFVKMKNMYQREIATHVELSEWSLKFRKDCLNELQGIGDEALGSGNYSEAIKQYMALEPLVGDLSSKHELLLKRSEAHSGMGPENWEMALQDAEEAIRLNTSSPWGYDRKHKVLYARRYYHEAAKALDEMIKSLTFSDDTKSIALRQQGVKPDETREIILKVVEETLDEPRPHILINTESGSLCDKQKQKEAFRAHPDYRDLILSQTSRVSTDDVWRQTVQKYFRYSTLSHTWEDQGEPEFRNVEKRSVDNLTESFPHTKLQTFCRKTHEHGYWWAWSDTCCINKAEQEVLAASLRSMYRWYSDSSLTIVHLKGVHIPLEVDLAALLDSVLDKLLEEFVHCWWNKRAWTLQEYFASRIIHFYTEDWKPYLPIDIRCSDSNPTNHKHLRAIQRGMELVTKLDAVHLAALKPGPGEARQKLRLASTRDASKKEDIAYSLLGIFQVTIEAIYGHDEVPRALGRLLEALLTKSSDVSILAWTGKPSEYNSCLPAEIAVYQDPESLHFPKPIDETTLAAAVSAMHSSMSPADIESAVRLHDRLLDVPPPGLQHGRLALPCISFLLQSIIPGPISGTYTATTTMLGKVEIKTAEDLPIARNMRLVHPWFRCLLDPDSPLLGPVRRESALKLLASLRQPFGALLLARTHDYERIAADQLITVQIREEVSAEKLMENTGVLYIR